MEEKEGNDLWLKKGFLNTNGLSEEKLILKDIICKEKIQLFDIISFMKLSKQVVLLIS